MSPRTLALGALVLAGAVVALVLALGRGDEPKRRAAPAPAVGARETVSSTASRPPAPAAAGAARTRPAALPAVKPEPLATTGTEEAPLWSSYDEEGRDPSWATAKEQAIRERVSGLLTAANQGRPGGVQVPQVECREIHCRLLVTGSDKRAFQLFVESLQDERGFYGDAALLSLDAYSEAVDKRTGDPAVQVRVHLKYER